VVVEQLERTRDAFVAATRGLSEAQYRYTATPEAWSIGEIVEHVALAERRMVDLIGKLPQAPPPSDAKTRGAARFARLDGIIPTRAQRRIVAPEPLVPTGTWPDPPAALAAFVDARAQTIAAVTTVDAETLEHVLPHRFFGEFDLEEWAYFTAVHVARHVAQVEEIRASNGFPAA
jgi:hypothetical protein